MKIKYCRKIYASLLKQYCIETEIINMLQGRIGKDIFLRHYMTPSSNFKMMSWLLYSRAAKTNRIMILIEKLLT